MMEYATQRFGSNGKSTRSEPYLTPAEATAETKASLSKSTASESAAHAALKSSQPFKDSLPMEISMISTSSLTSVYGSVVVGGDANIRSPSLAMRYDASAHVVLPTTVKSACIATTLFSAGAL